jgi:2-succinyl-6-hydroxy-2,4-cyclohexadiene-1-carboxylate synthase
VFLFMAWNTFYYNEFGSRNFPTILFLHGFLGSSQDWLPVINRLSDEFYCIAIDLPGHGRTGFDKPIKFTGMDDVAFSIKSLLTKMEIKKTNLIGYSLGGRLALFLLIKYPEFFEKVVLESASPGLRTEYERRKRIRQDRELALKLVTKKFRDFLKEWYDQPLFETLRQQNNFALLFEERLNNNAFYLSEVLKILGLGAQPSLWGKLEKNKNSLLLLTGEYDIKFGKIAKEMKKFSSRITHQVIGGAGHNIHFEKCDKFVAVVKNFLMRES